MDRGLGVTEALRDVLPAWSTEVFATLSLFGDLFVIVPALGLWYLADVVKTLRESDSPDRVDDTVSPLCSDRTAFVIATVFGGLALVVLLESAFGFSRPPEELYTVSASEYGFPSGHAMAATIFWGALALWTSPGPRSSRFATATVIVAVVGVSRLALGVHYLVDVLASFVFGALYLAAVATVVRGRPASAFAVAIGIATLAVIVSGGGGRALLALAGSLGAAVGWRLVELPPVRRTLVRAFA